MGSNSDEEYSNFEFLDYDENLENTNDINLELLPSRELFKWDFDKTSCLIETVKRHYDKFEYQIERKIWAEVATEVDNVCGFKATGDQCEFKFKSLKIIYEKVKSNNYLKTWIFFKALEDIFSNNREMNPDVIDVHTDIITPKTPKFKLVSPQNRKKENINESKCFIWDKNQKQNSFFEVNKPLSPLNSKLTSPEKNPCRILNKSKLSNIELQYSDEMQMENETFKWSIPQTVCLINAIKMHYHEFDCRIKSKVWAEVAQELENLCGLKVTGEQCDSKLKHLIKRYKEVKLNNNARRWKFFEDLKDLQSHMPTVNTIATSSTDVANKTIQKPNSSFILLSPENRTKTLNTKKFSDTEQLQLNRVTTQDNSTEQFKWTTSQTFFLIDAVKMHYDQFERRVKKKVFAKVAKEVEKLCGLMVTGYQCMAKFYVLEKMYEKIKLSNNSRAWEFFEALDDILSSKTMANRVSPDTNDFPEEMIQQSTTSRYIQSSAENQSENLNRSTTPDDLSEQFKWTTSQTSCLINAVKIHYEEFHCGVKKKAYAKIAKEVENLCGLQVTGGQCENKVKNLNKKYKRVISNNDARAWKFFEDVEDILSYSPNRMFACVIDLSEEMFQQSTNSSFMLPSAENESENLNGNILSDIDQRQLNRASTPDDFIGPFTWNTHQTNCLINAIKIHYEEFHCGIKRKAFVKIAREVENLCGLQVTGTQCENRFKSLKKMYDKGKLNKNPKTWKFCEALEDILSYRPNRVSECNIDLLEEIIEQSENESDILNRNKLSDIKHRQLQRAATPDDFAEKFNWNPSQTSCLVKAIKMHYDDFHYGVKKKAFTKIAKEVENLCGFQVTGEQCLNKFKNLQKNYNQGKLENNAKTWNFFEDLKDILSNKHTVNRLATDVNDFPEEMIEQSTNSSFLLPLPEDQSEILKADSLSYVENQQKRSVTPDDFIGSFRWSNSQIFCLIDAIKKYYHKFNSQLHTYMWDQVAKEVDNVCGLKVTAQQCENKLKHLKKMYKTVKANSNPSEWKFFEALDDILSNRQTANLVATANDFPEEEQLKRALTPDDSKEKFKWTACQTSCLLNAVKIHYEEFHCGVKKKVFAKVAKDVENLCGLQVTGAQCENRFKTLQKMYDKEKLNNNPKTLEFFEALEDILLYIPTSEHTSTSITDVPEKTIQHSTNSSSILSSEENQLKSAAMPDNFTEKFNWNPSQTTCLVNAIKMHYDEFQYGMKTKAFSKIAKEMENVCGLQVTGEQCLNRFKSLKKMYDKGKLNKNPKTWKFFETLEDILSNKHTDEFPEEMIQQSTTSAVTSDDLTEKFNWSISSTSCLVNAIKIHYDEFQYGVKKKAFTKIAKEVENLCGLQVTGAQCENRFKNLQKKYNQGKLNNNPKVWKFFEDLEDILLSYMPKSNHIYTSTTDLSEEMIHQSTTSNFKLSSAGNLKRPVTPNFVEKFTWTTSQNFGLINAIKLHFDEFHSGVKKKIFVKVAKEVKNLCGLKVTGQQCDDQLKDLIKTYEKVKLSNNPKTWKFFHAVEDILSHMPTTHHVSTSTTDLSEEIIQDSTSYQSKNLNTHNLLDIELRCLKRSSLPDNFIECKISKY